MAFGGGFASFPARRCFPFLAVGHSPSYRQRKRSLGSARDDDSGRTFFQRTLYTIQRISIPPRCHFERSEKSSLHSALSCSFRKRFPLFRYHTYDIIPFCKKDPSTSLGMTLCEYRSLTLPIYFPCNNDTREAPSTFAALLFFMRRTTPLNPTA